MWANQFDNLANRKSHYETTGPEIWKETNGNLDASFLPWVLANVAGVGAYLKEKDPGTIVLLILQVLLFITIIAVVI